MKKLSNKGFTLIELLATILIIGLVLGLTTYGIISSVDKAKTTSTTISVSGIKESARTYSGEYTDDTWKASNKSNNIYFCTTIQELINKGLLDKNAKSVEGNSISLNDYIAVVKDKTTKVIKKEFVLTPQISENETDKIEAFNYCTGGKKPENIKKLPTIKGEKTYTDTIIAEFTDAEFKTKDGTSSNITERKCSYAKSRIDGGNAEFIENNNTTINGNLAVNGGTSTILTAAPVATSAGLVIPTVNPAFSNTTQSFSQNRVDTQDQTRSVDNQVINQNKFLL